jgi:hypothetical protein
MREWSEIDRRYLVNSVLRNRGGREIEKIQQRK